ncbi:target of Myb protein 1 isoform 2 [Silurus meridionalis]|nr:target of Myb protein 1 isoform 2 [Silurus meridionalis]
MEFLTGNPFCTPVGQRIEYATSLQSEDWGLNMEICDIICETEDGPKDAVRAIKKRIVGNKNFKEIMLALTVLEACVKNCGYKFHALVSTRDFVEGVLVRTILPRNDPPLVVHDRILTIIQAWADAFRSSPDLTGVVCVYEELRRKGIKFPVADLCSPIHTPNKRVFPATEQQTPVSPTHQVPTQQQTSPWQNTEGLITFSPDQLKKLTSNLEAVHSNLQVMSEIMSRVDPGCICQSDTELLKGTNLIDLETPVSEPIRQTVSSLSSNMACLTTKEKNGIQRNDHPTGDLQDRSRQEHSVLDELAAGSSQVPSAGGSLIGFWQAEQKQLSVYPL